MHTSRQTHYRIPGFGSSCIVRVSPRFFSAVLSSSNDAARISAPLIRMSCQPTYTNPTSSACSQTQISAHNKPNVKEECRKQLTSTTALRRKSGAHDIYSQSSLHTIQIEHVISSARVSQFLHASMCNSFFVHTYTDRSCSHGEIITQTKQSLRSTNQAIRRLERKRGMTRTSSPSARDAGEPGFVPETNTPTWDESVSARLRAPLNRTPKLPLSSALMVHIE